MLDFLRGIGPGQILLVASYDDPSIILKEESRELLRGLGSSAAQTLGARDGWVFAGQKAAEGSAFEKHISSDEKTNTFDKWPAVIEISGCFKKT
ncbi:protein FAM3C-like [Engraulis encrasicolus]|uniref:protein FAM3C-like n=1 Tax=Engraulis encrasicolus TaxID=184585 RepID=UPI002FD70DC3